MKKLGNDENLKVKFVDLSRTNLPLMDEFRLAFDRIVENSSFIGGEYLSEFENSFSKYIGTKFCGGVASGSDALYIGLKALNITNGDEVIVPSFTFTATVDAVVRNGATPVFVDVDDQYNIDPNEISKAITPNTKAVIAVHLYGNPSRIKEIKEITDKNGIALIEDAAQAHGSEIDNKKIGSFGNISCFSFYPAKNLGAFGDGGAICTNDVELDKKIRMIREYGQRKKYYHEFVGLNSRLDPIQAAILNVKLKHLDTWNNERIGAAKIYSELLSGSKIVLPITGNNTKHVYHLYVVRVRDRDRVREKLEKVGISVGIHYPIPVHKLDSYAGIGIRYSLKNTEMYSRQVLSLPMFPHIKEEEIEYVTSQVLNIIK